MLKAITLHRPWGYAIANFGKDIENRTWQCPLPIGSYIAIHNGNKWDPAGAKFIQDVTDTSSAEMNPVEDPAGAIIAIAKFAGNTTSSSSVWFSGPIGWKLEEVMPINPVYCPGRQKLWGVEGSQLLACREAFRLAIQLKSVQIN